MAGRKLKTSSQGWDGSLPGESLASKVFTLALFLLVLGLPSIADWAGYEPYADANYEKRVKAQRPEMSIEDGLLGGNWPKYPRKYNRFFEDNFGLRTPMVKAFSYYKHKLLDAYQVNNVVIGKDGWLYYTRREPEADPMSCFRGTNLFTPGELADAAETLVLWRDWLAAQGKPLLVVLAPNKNSIYPEYMPDSVRSVNPRIRTEQFLEYLQKNTDLPVVDTRGPLLARKPRGEKLYYRTDTHWTPLGAFVAYEQIMGRVAELPGFESAPILREDDFRYVGGDKPGGDLAQMIILNDFFGDWNVELRPKRKPAGPKPRLAVMGDSFFEGLEPFFALQFQVDLFSISEEPNPRAVMRTNPQLVILEIVERHLAEIPEWLGSIRQVMGRPRPKDASDRRNAGAQGGLPGHVRQRPSEQRCSWPYVCAWLAASCLTATPSPLAEPKSVSPRGCPCRSLRAPYSTRRRSWAKSLVWSRARTARWPPSVWTRRSFCCCARSRCSTSRTRPRARPWPVTSWPRAARLPRAS